MSIDDCLLTLNDLKKEQLRLGKQINAKPYFPPDFFALGSIKRSLAISSGFRKMIKDRNYLCAGPLVRIHLDTAIRFHALTKVSDPSQLCRDMFKGSQIKDLKDRKGKKLTDEYLVNSLTRKSSWVKPAYKKVCGFVHFSDQHLLHVLKKATFHNTLTIKFGSGASPIEDSEFIFFLDVFICSTLLLREHLIWWIQLKEAKIKTGGNKVP